MPPRYTLTLDQGGHFIFRLHASDGEVLLTSAAFADRGSALHSLNLVRHKGRKNDNFEIRSSREEQGYFVLKNPKKNELLGQSELYADLNSLPPKIEAVKSGARTAKLYDMTVAEDQS
jgi:uncharacterized protein YegP (UPF0339 family)